MKTRMWSAGGKAVSARGFSLLELLVVMLIISLSVVAIAAALPRTATGPAIELAATRLATGFKKARMRAITRSRVVDVVIDSDSHRYRVGATGTTPLPNAVAILPPGSTLVRFYPDGGADAAAIRLTAGQRTLRIDVSPLTGRVTFR